MNMPVDAFHFEATLRENGIPPRPAVLEVISREVRKESPDLRLLDQAVRSDVAIAGGLIKIANSSYFGAQRRVRSVLEAMAMLGLQATAQAVACVALRNAFPNMNLDRFWDASAKIAALAGWLVGERRWKGVRAEDAYTLGLFRDCGIAVILQRIPAYTDVLRQANAEAVRSFTAVEEDLLPVSHAQVGAMMTEAWWLPDEITEAIRHHHDLAAIRIDGDAASPSANSRALIAVVQLAEYLFQQATGLSATREWGKLGEACLGRLQIGADELPELVQGAAAALAE